MLAIARQNKVLPVTKSLARLLLEDLDPVVVAHGTRHLVEVHVQVVFLHAPELGQPVRVSYFEDALGLVLPRDAVAVLLLGVIKQLLQEVPQQADTYKRL